jgi:hypothetical protein
MSKNESKPLSRRENIVVQEFGNEILIYDLLINKAFSLNETSALVWQACDGNKTVSEIAMQISRQLKSPVSEDFVWLALEQLEKENLIKNDAEIRAPFEGLSRREVIRKVGLGALVTLPVISSLIAPTAVNAQSGCAASSGKPNGCTCTSAGQCASNCCGDAGATNECTAQFVDPVGSECRANCECATNCCGFGFTCATVGAKTTGAPCRVNCECASNSCTSGTCA